MARQDVVARLSIDDSDVKALENRLLQVKNGDGLLLAMTRALNKTSDKAKTAGAQEIYKQLNLTSAYIKQQISSAKDSPSNRATFNNLVSKVTARRRGIRLARFLTNESAVHYGSPGTIPRVKVKRGGATKPITGGFLLKLKYAGVPGLFVRQGGKLKHLYGPSPSQAFESVKDDISPAMAAYMQVQLKTQAEGVLRQYFNG